MLAIKRIVMLLKVIGFVVVVGGGCFFIFKLLSVWKHTTDTSSPTGAGLLSDGEGFEIASRIRSLGYHCEKALSLERTEIDHQGNKIYKLRCGYSGPYYRVLITPDGQQVTTPW